MATTSRMTTTKPAVRGAAAKKKRVGNPKPMDWRPIVLEALSRVPVVREACQAAGITRMTLWRARKDDPDFNKAVEDAMEDGIDCAEQEAFRRAVAGYEEPVVHKGELAWLYEPVLDEKGAIQRDEKGDVIVRPVRGPDGKLVPLTIRKHSDQLLSLILKGRRKQVYADRIEQTGAGGGPISIDATKRAARVAALMDAAAQRKAAAGGHGE